MSKEAKIKAEIAEYKALLDDSTVPQDEKDFAKEEIKDLEAKLSKLGGKGAKTSSTERVYIEFLNKAKNFTKDKKYFKDAAAAKKWAIKTMDKFDPDMIKYETVEPKTVAPNKSKKAPKKSKGEKLSVTDFRLWGTGEEGWFIEEKETGKQINPSLFGKKSWNTKKEAVSDLEKYLKKGSKFKPSAPKKEKLVSQYKGKKLTDLDEKECDELLADIRARREKATKSSAKSKSKPVVEKVAANVATAVKQAIDNVPAADIDKAKIEKFKKLEVAAKHFMDEMKSILGEDFDKESVKDEFKPITDLIEALRKKYTK